MKTGGGKNKQEEILNSEGRFGGFSWLTINRSLVILNQVLIFRFIWLPGIESPLENVLHSEMFIPLLTLTCSFLSVRIQPTKHFK